ncbi:MAG: DnaJ domain-containing protein [Spirochaetes bacterium]|nr:DnaJ domain-containing protein [Spirochaetota bacterium]
MKQTKNYYQILNVKYNAGMNDIKAAFKKLALMYHPDLSKKPNANEAFRDILEAYHTLSDTHAKFAYDIAMQNYQAPSPFSMRYDSASPSYRPQSKPSFGQKIKQFFHL